MRYLILIVLVLSTFGCSKSDSNLSSSSRIINGVPVAVGVGTQIVPVSISYTNGEQGLCTGTALSDYAVLTAAHCLVEATNITISTNGRSVTVTSTHIAPGFFEDLSIGAIFNDVAVIRTKEPLGTGALAVLGSRAPALNESIQIYGYGLDQSGNFGSLLNGAMTLSLVTPNHLFANFDGRGANTCSGDSGGPALANITDAAGNFVGIAVAGITSSGTRDDCQKGDTTLFTNLSEPGLISFILSVAPEAAVL